MSNDKKPSDKKEDKVAAPIKKAYVLKTDVTVDGEVVKKGEKIMLTEEGRIAFKRKHRI